MIIVTILFLAFQFSIVQQPPGEFVSLPANADEVAQVFPIERSTKATVLSAHSHLAGQSFYSLKSGDRITLTTSDGGLVEYNVTGVYAFAVRDDIWRDLNGGGSVPDWGINVRFFARFKGLILFTCLEVDGRPSGGRLIIKAERVR